MDRQLRSNQFSNSYGYFPFYVFFPFLLSFITDKTFTGLDEYHGGCLIRSRICFYFMGTWFHPGESMLLIFLVFCELCFCFVCLRLVSCVWWCLTNIVLCILFCLSSSCVLCMVVSNKYCVVICLFVFVLCTQFLWIVHS